MGHHYSPLTPSAAVLSGTMHCGRNSDELQLAHSFSPGMALHIALCMGPAPWLFNNGASKVVLQIEDVQLDVGRKEEAAAAALAAASAEANGLPSQASDPNRASAHPAGGSEGALGGAFNTGSAANGGETEVPVASKSGLEGAFSSIFLGGDANTSTTLAPALDLSGV